MNLLAYLKTRTSLIAALAFIAALSTSSLLASGGSTDPIPGTSKSGLSGGGSGGGGGGTSGGGGGGGKTVTPTPTPTPTPAPQPIVSGTLTFAVNMTYGGIAPQATGSYRIDPYYPTLSLCTVNVQTSNVNLPDGSALYLRVTTVGGTQYPFTSNVIPIVAGSGTGSYSLYVSHGSTVQMVEVYDINGNVILTGI